MPNLIETYSRATGLKIDKPWLKRDFWPLPLLKYVTLSAGSGQAAKNYSSWQIVIDLLNPILAPLGIGIVQLGDDKTPLFSGTYDLRGKMNIAQSTYLIERAVLHLGVDSWSAHAAGVLKTPLVALYGTTDKLIHGPHWRGPKTVLLESHRNGARCTFGAEGGTKTVDLIRPEVVAASVLDLLDISHVPFPQTQYIGTNYLQTIIEVVPNAVPNLGSNEMAIIVRMDYEHNEDGLQAILQSGRKVHLFTKAPINLNLLISFKGQILSYNHEIDESCPPDYLKVVSRVIPQRSFFSRVDSLEALAALRFKYFDICTIDHLTHRTKDRLISESALYLNVDRDTHQISLDKAVDSGILSFRTNKYLLSSNLIYLSYAHLLAGQPTPAIGANESAVIDTAEFWRETNHHLLTISYVKDPV